ncbi:MAG: hypothetical protein JO248_09550 [Acidimicrobiia bacterium]|nr:hypothetical protein [Acidimicrobiia bacterium]MBV8984669.1 hypothetical protein [Acidimicrobiia bacterium]
MAVIETRTFRLADGIDEAEFLEADEQARTGFLYHQAGMMRATTARADAGEWIVVVLWASYEDADAAAEVERTDPHMDRFDHMTAGADRKRYSTFD